MRFLIGAAAAAVLAFVAYFFFNEFTAWRAANARQVNENEARLELFRLADARVGEVEKVRKLCRLAYETQAQDEFRARLAANCLAFGYR